MSAKQHEYHLICRVNGQSHGGLETLEGAREYARDEFLEAWDIFHGNLLIERREPTIAGQIDGCEALALPEHKSGYLAELERIVGKRPNASRLPPNSKAQPPNRRKREQRLHS